MAFQFLRNFLTVESSVESEKPSATPKIERFNALDPSTTTDLLVSIIERDGGVIVENLIAQPLAQTIKSDLKPYFDTDRVDPSGFFPSTTQRATGLLAKSDACAELACNKNFIDVANRMISSTYSYWTGQRRETVTSKPVISSTVGFRVNPGGRQQDLHRDDSDYHTRNVDMPMMLGCVTALTKTTKENGATIVIPGSHKWGPERCPYDHEAIPAELNPGDALIFVGNLYHAGGGNITKDEARETVGIFLSKPYYRQAENQYLMVPPEKARRLSPQAQRLLGYGISRPSLGFVEYMDPMRILFGVEDEETVDM
ncbi:PhyH-domain-containing protein [Aulographum hederae CBS 113979]|uniref:PhyH-domain-containing protein n=1 Tax=Aulographum hederae CBS 113979 TaxID=1176131 RepID=A0A6G1GX39_9PEZI|nr:PhyH-domain-containing protein [Aulographum hederae CBS 113979]